MKRRRFISLFASLAASLGILAIPLHKPRIEWKKAQFIAEFSYAIKPVHPDWQVAVFYERKVC